MIRGTTPTFKLKIADANLDLREARNIYATFEQGSTELTKTGEDLELTVTQVEDVYQNEIDVFLSQAESLLFKA